MFSVQAPIQAERQKGQHATHLFTSMLSGLSALALHLILVSGWIVSSASTVSASSFAFSTYRIKDEKCFLNNPLAENV